MITSTFSILCIRLLSNRTSGCRACAKISPWYQHFHQHNRLFCSIRFFIKACRLAFKVSSSALESSDDERSSESLLDIVAVRYHTALYKPPPRGIHVKYGAKIMARGAPSWSSVSDADSCDKIAPRGRTVRLLLAVLVVAVAFVVRHQIIYDTTTNFVVLMMNIHSTTNNIIIIL